MFRATFSASPQLRLPDRLPWPYLPLRQPPPSSRLSPAMRASRERFSKLVGSSPPPMLPSLSVTRPSTRGASRPPDSRPLPFSLPCSFSTIGTNGRATDRSRPARLNSPLSGLLAGRGSI